MAVAVIFTTLEAAINDLPMLLSVNSNSHMATEQGSDNGSEESTSISSTTSFPRQTFSLAFDPTALDPGTMPISPAIFNVSARWPEGIAAVVVGAGFSQSRAQIMKRCGEVEESVVWFWTDFEKSKKLGVKGKVKSEDLGRNARRALEVWVRAREVGAKEGKGVSRVRNF